MNDHGGAGRDGGDTRGPASSRVRMKDVADAAGVSLQTVSRVVNATGTVTDETSLRVRAAIESLGYRPNVWARSLASKSRRTVGVVVVGESRHGLGSSVLAVEEAAPELGLITVSTHVAVGDAASTRIAVDRILGSDASGMVVLGSTADLFDQVGTVWEQVPTVVLTTATSTAPRIATVAIDQSYSMERIVDHLVERGCRRIAHLTGDPRWSDAQVRAEAFTAAASRRGVSGQLIQADSWDSSVGYEVAADLDLHDLPDALVAANDSMALGAMAALSDRGVRIPHDIKVVGFDDVPEAAYYRPSLTTVRQDFRLLGVTAIDQLEQMIHGADGRNVRVEAPIIFRDSTATDGPSPRPD